MKNNKKKSNNQTVKKHSSTSSFRKKCFALGVVILFVFVFLIGRVGYIQFIEGDYYKYKENNQSIASTVIEAKRGTIYDCNKKALAISADVDTITVNPDLIKQKGENEEEKTKLLKEKLAHKFSEIFELDYEETLAKLESSKSVETIASKVEIDKVEELKQWLKENKINSGINIDLDTKRYYPYNNLASNLIGFCGTDNQGLDGVELSYDSILKGITGKITTSISVTQDAIPDEEVIYILQ